MAGSASRIYNFCRSYPNTAGCPFPAPYSPSPPTPPTPPTNAAIQKVQEYLDEWNAASKAPFSAVTFGNALNGYETFIGSGNAGPNGEPVDPSMYWRWASMTKMVGLITLAAALEDGILTLDDKVWTYIPAVGNITQYVSGSTAVVDGSGNPEYDAFGTPKYTQVLTTVGPGAVDPDNLNLGKKITIRMLINSSSGFGYSFWGIGNTRVNIVNGLSGLTEVQNYIAWLQNIEANNSYADTITSSYDNMSDITFTDSIIERLNYPLLCDPGTTNIYDTGTTFLGAVISSALAQKGILQTSAEYTQSRIFNPLGMTTCWLNCGSLNPPSDVLTKLTNAFFVRQETPGSISGSYQKGANVSYNTLYGCFDSNAVGDGFTNQELTVFLQTKQNNYLSNDNYAGGYDWSGCGTMSDFCKLLKLLIQKGYNPATKTQILSKSSVEWILSSKYSPAQLAMGMNGPGTGPVNLLNNGGQRTWCGGLSRFLEGDTLPYACGPYTYAWGGYFGTNFIFDIQTGNYAFFGTQSSAASWQLSTSTKPFQPAGPFIWDTLTSMF